MTVQKNVYAFDCDETLEISRGPVTIDSLIHLKAEGHILGICGNWGLVVQAVYGWENLFSFVGQIGIHKTDFLLQLRAYINADDYVFVGNDHSTPGKVYTSPNDALYARQAGWRFIREDDFAKGVR